MERIRKILENMGFTQADARVYVYLAKVGPQSVKDIAIGLHMTERQIATVLKSLQGKGAIISTPEQPLTFAALALEEVLHLFVKISVDQAEIISKSKKGLIISLQKATCNNNSSPS